MFTLCRFLEVLEGFDTLAGEFIVSVASFTSFVAISQHVELQAFWGVVVERAVGVLRVDYVSEGVFVDFDVLHLVLVSDDGERIFSFLV